MFNSRYYATTNQHSYGAFQLALRLTQLNIGTNIYNDYQITNGQTNYIFADPRISVQKAHTWNIGLNWFYNRNVLLITEYDYTSFIGGCSTGAMSAPRTPGCLTAGNYATASTSSVLNRPPEKIFMQRLQLYF